MPNRETLALIVKKFVDELEEELCENWREGHNIKIRIAFTEEGRWFAEEFNSETEPEVEKKGV